jgi:hypothetical protein
MSLLPDGLDVMSHFGKRLVWILAALAIAGCGRAVVEPPPNPTQERLLKLGRAYLDAANRLGRPPKDFAEIGPETAGAGNELLQSPNDGQEFVVFWGVDFNALPAGAEDPYTVGMFEKTGVGGKRYVLRFPTQVKLMTDEEFKKAVFPPGHAAP